MDSTGISALVVARNHLTSDGNDLDLTRPTPIVRRTLEIVGIDQLGNAVGPPAWDSPDSVEAEGRSERSYAQIAVIDGLDRGPVGS
jgi:hypothetical protein